MLKKSFVSFLLVFILCLSVVSTSFANLSSLSNESEDTKTDKVPISPEIQSQLLSGSIKGSNVTVAITDESELKKIATEQELEKVPSKIEYEYEPAEIDSKLIIESPDQIVSPSRKGQICYTKDFGSGFYNASDDLYKRFTVDGPDTFEINRTIKKKSTYSGSFGASVSTIEASVGFSFGVSESVTFKSTTPIPSHQRAVINLYTTYHKVLYAVDTGSVCQIGYAYRPNGTFIQKTFYNK